MKIEKIAASYLRDFLSPKNIHKMATISKTACDSRFPNIYQITILTTYSLCQILTFEKRKQIMKRITGYNYLKIRYDS